MKKNKLSVWSTPYRKSYYWTHPWKWIHCIYWNIRNFIHRGQYGYAYVDVWNWYFWWMTVGAEGLRYLADHGQSYPGNDKWDTPEKWHDYLTALADKMQWCADSFDIAGHQENEYYQMHEEIIRNRMERAKDDDGYFCTRVNATPEEEDILKRYYKREEELVKDDDVKRNEIFREIGENLGRFWD